MDFSHFKMIWAILPGGSSRPLRILEISEHGQPSLVKQFAFFFRANALVRVLENPTPCLRGFQKAFGRVEGREVPSY